MNLKQVWDDCEKSNRDFYGEDLLKVGRILVIFFVLSIIIIGILT